MRRDLAPVLLIAVLVSTLSACAPRVARTPLPDVAPRALRDWIDLQPGWRVRVVIPITKSGGFLPKLGPGPPSGGNKYRSRIDLSRPSAAGPIPTAVTASSDLLGYEVSIYSVRRGRGGAMHVDFRSAVAKEGKKTTQRPRPLVRLFVPAPGSRFVRILHLTRSKQVDYDAAILASRRLDALDAFTRRVERRPADCRDSEEVSCSWIPLGIAVIPERPRVHEDKRNWEAAY